MQILIRAPGTTDVVIAVLPALLGPGHPVRVPGRQLPPGTVVTVR
jgi:hypothetical protein